MKISHITQHQAINSISITSPLPSHISPETPQLHQDNMNFKSVPKGIPSTLFSNDGPQFGPGARMVDEAFRKFKADPFDDWDIKHDFEWNLNRLSDWDLRRADKHLDYKMEWAFGFQEENFLKDLKELVKEEMNWRDIKPMYFDYTPPKVQPEQMYA